MVRNDQSSARTDLRTPANSICLGHLVASFFPGNDPSLYLSREERKKARAASPWERPQGLMHAALALRSPKASPGHGRS